MNIKTKISSIVIATLLIGVVIGALINGAIIRKHRRDSARRFRTERGFGKFLENILEPEDPQKEQIEKVLKKYSESLLEIRTRHMSEFGAAMDSMKSELDTLLTEEQKEQLNKKLRKPGFRRNRHQRPSQKSPNRR